MIPLDPTGLVTAGLDAIGGIVSANQARNAFKSRYQDTVKDMKKAGLNPALAYGQGGGNPQTSDLPQVGESYGRGAQAGASAAQARATAEKTQAETALLKAQTADWVQNLQLKNKVLGADFNLRMAQTGLTGAQTDYTAGAQTQATGAQAFKTTMEGNWQQRKNRMLDLTADSDVIAQLSRNAADLFAPATAQATQRGIELENQIRQLSLPQLQSMAEYYRGAGKYQPYADAIARYIGTLMPKVNVDMAPGMPAAPAHPRGWNP